jgi:hypothetical protein
MRVVSLPNFLRWLREQPVTTEELSLEMERYRVTAREEALALKDPYVELSRLKQLYASLDDKERSMADAVIRQWALSDSDQQRSAAIPLILDWSFALKAALLTEMRDRLPDVSVGPTSLEVRYIQSLLEAARS